MFCYKPQAAYISLMHSYLTKTLFENSPGSVDKPTRNSCHKH